MLNYKDAFVKTIEDKEQPYMPKYSHETLIKKVKVVYKSSSAQNYIKRAKANPTYRQQNKLTLPSPNTATTLTIQLSQDNKAINVYQESVGSIHFLDRIKLSELKEQSKSETVAKPKQTDAKTTPTKAKGKTKNTQEVKSTKPRTKSKAKTAIKTKAKK